MKPSTLLLTRSTKQKIWKINGCLSYKRHLATGTRSVPLWKASGESHAFRNTGPVRTRFAPSPTGHLHLGSLRTALFNFLAAKATGGQFILRIEDTDSDRTIKGAEDLVYKDLEWAGIEWDEGPKVGGPYGPYKQSERIPLYYEHGQKLLEVGLGYRCFCSKKQLHIQSEHQAKLGLPPSYNRTCAHIPKEQSDDWAEKGRPYVIRLKVPDVYPSFNDNVFGTIKQAIPKNKYLNYAEPTFEDPILIKSDGFPTYHLANVVDDHLMKITDVIRGSEWIPSTHKHVLLYQAFGWEPPRFSHVNLLLNEDRRKLSKRDGAVDIGAFRDLGYFPETLTNFAALLGWSHNEKVDVMSLEELIRNASMKYTKSDSVVTFGKLDYLQRKHAARYASLLPSEKPLHPSRDLVELAAKPILKLINNSKDQSYTFYNCHDDEASKLDYITKLLILDADRYTLPPDFLARNTYFFTAPTLSILQDNAFYSKLSDNIKGVTPTAPSDFSTSFLGFDSIAPENWNVVELKSIANLIVSQGVMLNMAELAKTKASSKEEQQRAKKNWTKLVHGYIRWAIFAGKNGPDGAESMVILGKDETMRRLELAHEVTQKRLKEESGNDAILTSAIES